METKLTSKELNDRGIAFISPDAEDPIKNYRQQKALAKMSKPIPSITEVARYHGLGLSVNEIETLTGYPTEFVMSTVKNFGDLDVHVTTYKDTKALVMNKIQKMVVDNITDDKLKVTCFKDLATGFKVFHEAGRLEDNKSTVNVSHSALLQSVAEKMLHVEPCEEAEIVEENT